MGALTLKTFPFELRGWDLEKFLSIDITDSFGSNIKLCIANNKIIQIEPHFNNSIKTSWIHNKARQFFDGLTFNITSLGHSVITENLYKKFKNLHKTVYLFELCVFKNKFNTYYFTVIYENLSINLFSLLLFLTAKYYFVKLKQANQKKILNNLEKQFLINFNLTTFNKSSVCLLIGTNPRLELPTININIKQRMLKGNFKCFILGSMLNLGYNYIFLGKTTIKVVKSLIEGTHLICQDFKTAELPLVLKNSNILQRKDAKTIASLINNLSSFKNTVKINQLNASIFETGLFYLKKSDLLQNKDFTKFSFFYLINLTTHHNFCFYSIFKVNLLYFKTNFKVSISNILFEQNFYGQTTNLKDKFKYLYIPTKTVFETTNLFLSNKGNLKQTNKNILNNKKNTKSGWKVIRNLLTHTGKHVVFLNKKAQFKTILSFMNKKQFYNLIKLLYKTVNCLNTLTVTKKLNGFYFNIKNLVAKFKKLKFIDTKLKFWLNDFFTGSSDGFSKNSLIMVKCSNIKRAETSNFF